MIQYAKHPHVYGVVPELPLSGFPEGRIKIRMRPNNFARAHVFSKTGVREFFVRIVDGTWQPSVEIGSNQTQ